MTGAKRKIQGLPQAAPKNQMVTPFYHLLATISTQPVAPG